MKLPKYKISEINNVINQTFDLFICSTSFESRSLSISRNIEGRRIRKALIVSNLDDQNYLIKNKKELIRLYKNKHEIIDVSTSDPLFTADNINRSLQIEINEINPRMILVDITTFTHEILLILLRLLKNISNNRTISICYANASDYSVGDSLEFKWLTRGIKEVRSVLGYPGEINPLLKTHLIIIVGYEHDRAKSIIEALEPNSISLGCGTADSVTTEKNSNANYHYLSLVNNIAASFSNVNCFNVYCDDPFGTLHELQVQINNNNDKNILIAPMNNKITTLATAWVGIRNPQIQLCYAPALVYNYERYSKRGYHFYYLEDIFN